MTALALAGACGGGHSNQSATKTTPGLAALIPSNADVGQAARELIHAGPADTALTRPTIDVCARKFPSEATRTARRQISYEAGGHVPVSIEAVRYRHGAAQAVSELEHALTDCAPGSLSQTEVADNDRRFGDHQLTVTGVLKQEGPTVFSANVYLYRGDILVVTYAFRDTREQALAAARDVAAVVKLALDHATVAAQ